MTPRASLLFVLLLTGCGGATGWRRPDYAAEAQARCDQADAAPDPHRALALYGMALDADPKYSRAYAGRARVFEANGRGGEAERAYSMAVEVAPDDEKARHLVARAQFFKRVARIEPALRDLDRAVSLMGTWPVAELIAETRLLRAECRLAMRRWDGVLEDLDAADKAGLDSGQRDRAHNLRIRAEAAK